VAGGDTVQIVYSDDLSGGAKTKWWAHCGDTAGGGGDTYLDSNTTVVVSTFYKLAIQINAAGTSAEFFIDGTSFGSISTSLPTATRMSVGVLFVKSIGNTARNADVDYIYDTWTATSTR
jgi:hypothetical protein